MYYMFDFFMYFCAKVYQKILTNSIVKGIYTENQKIVDMLRFFDKIGVFCKKN